MDHQKKEPTNSTVREATETTPSVALTRALEGTQWGVHIDLLTPTKEKLRPQVNVQSVVGCCEQKFPLGAIGASGEVRPKPGGLWQPTVGGGGGQKASVSDCLPLAAPIGLSPLRILTLCGPERVLVGGGGGSVSPKQRSRAPCVSRGRSLMCQGKDVSV